MTNSKKQSPIIKFITGIFKSGTARCVFVLFVLVLATLGMFMLDELNHVRKFYLMFLEDNVVLSFMKFFGIERMNILKGAWVIFFFCIAFILFLLISNAVEKTVLKNSNNAKLVKIIYYLTVVVVFAILVLLAYVLGAFESLNESAGVFLNLVYAVLICLLFIVIIFLLAVVLYYVLKLLTYCCVVAFTYLNKFGKEVHAEQKRFIVESGEGSTEDYDLTSRERVFPALVKIDDLGAQTPTVNTEIELNQLALQFQSYASNVHKIYYDLPLIRSFIAGLGTSRLIILEGLSGTGKSMLPRLFCEFIG